MISINKLPKMLALTLIVGLTQMPVQGSSQEEGKAAPLGPPPFVELPSAASGPLGGANVAQVLVLTKQGKLKTFYGREVASFESAWAPPDLEIDVLNVNDPGKDIIVTATIPRSSLGNPTEPIEVIPSILIKVGNSTCGWNYFGSGGSVTCQKVCYD